MLAHNQETVVMSSQILAYSFLARHILSKFGDLWYTFLSHVHVHNFCGNLITLQNIEDDTNMRLSPSMT
jgi:hypothetical protein